MVSPVNATVPGLGSAVSITDALEHVVATSQGINLDGIQTIAVLEWSVDITNSSSGTTVTFKLERGTAIGGTSISKAPTWGPFPLTASARQNFSGAGFDIPGLEGGLQYVLTTTVASNSGTVTVNTAVLEVQAQSAS